MSGRETFSLQKVIQVQYRNESCVDEGGLKRDFLSMLMAQLLTSNLLTQYTDNVGYSPSATYWHCHKASIQRLGYSPSVNVLALQQGQYTKIGILTQCERTGTATRPVYNDWDTHPVQMYWHCNKDSTQRLGYSPSANVLALPQGQYTTIGILIQCKCTGTATRTVHNDWDTHPVRTYWHCHKASIQRGILTQCERTGTATRTVHNDWDTHPVRTYWHCNKDSTQRLGYSPSVNVLALQQGQYTTIGILTQCERTGTATRTVHNDWDTHPV